MESNAFLGDALALIRQRCQNLDTTDTEQLVDLAAHLFAIASLIPKQGTAGLVLNPNQLGRAPRSLKELRRQLGSLSPSMQRADLYGLLGSALQALDQEIGKRWKGTTGTRHTRLELQGLGACRLNNEVAIWLRHPSALRRLRSRRGSPQDPGPHPARFLTSLGMAWNSDLQQPPLEAWTGPAATSPLVEESGRDAVKGKSFRVALCPLDTPAHPQFRAFLWQEDKRCYFQALGQDAMAGPDALDEHLEDLVKAAAGQGVHLLVLPELMVSRTAREHLVELMRRNDRSRHPYGVVAGSFHVWADGEEPVTHWPFNESPTLSSSGEILLRHHKRGRFRLTSKQVKADPRFFPERPDPCPKKIVEVVEGIRHEPTLQILETTLGRMAVAICADCIAPDLTRLTETMARHRPDLLIIVAMSPQTTEFEEIIGDLGRRGIGSLFVNARAVCRPTARPQPLLVATNLALWEPAGAPPTRVRWRCGDDEPQVRYYQPTDARPGDDEMKERKKGWRPLSQALGRTGVEWLLNGGERLGLVVDLGVHWD